MHQDNTSFSTPDDLDGATIGVCAGCTYEFYLDKSLQIPGVDMEYVIDNTEIRGYDTDLSALMEMFILAAALYWVLTIGSTWVQSRLESRLSHAYER